VHAHHAHCPPPSPSGYAAPFYPDPSKTSEKYSYLFSSISPLSPSLW